MDCLSNPFYLLNCDSSFSFSYVSGFSELEMLISPSSKFLDRLVSRETCSITNFLSSAYIVLMTQNVTKHSIPNYLAGFQPNIIVAIIRNAQWCSTGWFVLCVGLCTLDNLLLFCIFFPSISAIVYCMYRPMYMYVPCICAMLKLENINSNEQRLIAMCCTCFSVFFLCHHHKLRVQGIKLTYFNI